MRVFIFSFLILLALPSSTLAQGAFPAQEEAAGDSTPDRSLANSIAPERLKRIHGALVMNSDGTVLYSKDTDGTFPIASITKLMTALVFLEHNPGFSKEFIVRKRDDADPVKVPFRSGDRVTVKDLFYASLVGSRNNAARALAHSTGIPEKDFVTLMNEKAAMLGMAHTLFVDTTGLDPKNESTPHDVATLGRVAFSSKKIARALSTERYSFQAVNTKTGIRRKFLIRNTNRFIRDGGVIKEGKTGYIDESGYNFVARGTDGSKEIIAVLFGARTSKSRFNLTRDLVAAALGSVVHSAMK